MKTVHLIFSMLTIELCLGASCASAIASGGNSGDVKGTASGSETTAAAEPANTKSGASIDDSEEFKMPESFLHSSTTVSKSNCKIKCLNPHAESRESADVIKIVLEMYKAYSEQDLDTLSKYMDKDCTTFDEGTNKLITGRQAVLDEIKAWLKKNAASAEAPLLSYTIERPFCQVHNDSAVVTFKALKEVGGEHPRKFESRCTDIFRKDGSSWVRTHYRSHWTEVAQDNLPEHSLKN